MLLKLPISSSYPGGHRHLYSARNVTVLMSAGKLATRAPMWPSKRGRVEIVVGPPISGLKGYVGRHVQAKGGEETPAGLD